MDNNITLRPATVEDAERLLEYLGQINQEKDLDLPMVAEPVRFSLETERQFLGDIVASNNSIFLIAEAGQQIVGIVNLHGGQRLVMRHVAELGITVHKDWRNRGVGMMMMQEAIRWAKSSGVLKRIELKVYASNQGAIHLYEKLGFEIEGRCRKAIYQRGEYLDNLIMALLI